MILELGKEEILFAVFDVFCAICYHLYNFKNEKITHAGVLHLVKLQAKVFFIFLKLYKWYQIAQGIT